MNYFNLFIILTPGGTLAVLVFEYLRMALSLKNINSYILFYGFALLIFSLICIIHFVFSTDFSYIMTLRDIFFWSFIIIITQVSLKRVYIYHNGLKRLVAFFLLISFLFYVVGVKGGYAFIFNTPGGYIDYLINNPFFENTVFFNVEWRRFNSYFLFATSAGWGLGMLSLIFLDKALVTRKISKKLKFIFLTILMLALVFCTVSRSSILLTSAFLILLIACYKGIYFRFVCIVILLLLSQFFYEIFIVMSEERVGSKISRMIIYSESYKLFLNSPFGYFKTMPIEGLILDAGTHSTYFAVAIKYGVFGLCLLVVGYIKTLIMSFKKKSYFIFLMLHYLVFIGIVEEITIDPLNVLLIGYVITYIRLKSNVMQKHPASNNYCN